MTIGPGEMFDKTPSPGPRSLIFLFFTGVLLDLSFGGKHLRDTAKESRNSCGAPACKFIHVNLYVHVKVDHSEGRLHECCRNSGAGRYMLLAIMAMSRR